MSAPITGAPAQPPTDTNSTPTEPSPLTVPKAEETLAMFDARARSVIPKRDVKELPALIFEARVIFKALMKLQCEKALRRRFKSYADLYRHLKSHPGDGETTEEFWVTAHTLLSKIPVRPQPVAMDVDMEVVMSQAEQEPSAPALSAHVDPKPAPDPVPVTPNDVVATVASPPHPNVVLAANRGSNTGPSRNTSPTATSTSIPSPTSAPPPSTTSLAASPVPEEAEEISSKAAPEKATSKGKKVVKEEAKGKVGKAEPKVKGVKEEPQAASLPQRTKAGKGGIKSPPIVHELDDSANEEPGPSRVTRNTAKQATLTVVPAPSNSRKKKNIKQEVEEEESGGREESAEEEPVKPRRTKKPPTPATGPDGKHLTWPESLTNILSNLSEKLDNLVDRIDHVEDSLLAVQDQLAGSSDIVDDAKTQANLKRARSDAPDNSKAAKKSRGGGPSRS